MPSANWDFNLGLIFTTTGEYDRYDRLIQKQDGEFRFAEWYYGPQQWFSAKVDISHQQDGVALFDDSKLGLSYQQRLRDGVTLTLSSMIDGRNFNQGGHKLGLGLELEA